MTPDAPLTACWAGAFYFIERALIGEKHKAWWGVGICIGLGLLSKYTIVLLAPAIILFLIIDSRSRHWFYSPKPYIAAIIALLLFSPVIFWNYSHDWASFAFQGARRAQGSFHFSLGDLIVYIMVLLSPVGVFAAFYSMFRRINIPGDSARDALRKHKLALVFTLLPLSVFFLFSITKRVQYDWTGPVWLAILPFIAYDMVANINKKTSRFLKTIQCVWPATIVFLMLFYGIILHYVTLGLPGVPYPENAPLVGWRQTMAKQIESIETELELRTGLEPFVVGMDKYKIASELSFYRSEDKEDSIEYSENEGVLFTTGRHLFGNNSLMYAYWVPKHEIGKNPLIIISNERSDLEKLSENPQLDKIGQIHCNIITKDAAIIGRYYYCIAEKYIP